VTAKSQCFSRRKKEEVNNAISSVTVSTTVTQALFSFFSELVGAGGVELTGHSPRPTRETPVPDAGNSTTTSLEGAR
jgi:hypothetical protein